MLDISGAWAFELDPADSGMKECWYNRNLSNQINLPGSLQEQGYGDDITVDTPWTGDVVDRSWFEQDRYARFRQPDNLKIPFWLQPVKYYKGAAWYQREIEIPEDWQGKQVTLNLERPHWETMVWLDERLIGAQISLSTPHVYDLGGVSAASSDGITKGKHILTIRVDNRMILNVGPNSHSMTDHTQFNWNGIVGKITLQATSPVWLGEIQVYPDVPGKRVTVQVKVHKSVLSAVSGSLNLHASSPKSDHSHALPSLMASLQLYEDVSLIEVNYPLGSELELWNEFSPALYNLSLDLKVGSQNGETWTDRREVSFGMRQLSTIGTQLALNNRPIFLRGTLECCIFPLTGYPPTDVASWKKILKVLKDHGLNHIRFHSYCPPEAAFIAGDEMGVYYQVECGSWANQGASIGNGEPVDQWLYDEAQRIIAAYGNHPSFLLMAYGNEPAGDIVGYLSRWVTYWKQQDPRRFHTSGAGWPMIPESDYHSTFAPRVQLWGAGLNSRINALPPETTTDYRDFIQAAGRPVISHEIGQWCAYPNFDEIQKYTGVLKAKNFELFQQTLEENGMGDQAHDFLIASGKLQTLCYKEDIESALRTPGFAGFQLLDLHDFPGQGTALVGVLDPFWEQKGYVSPAEYARFCNSIVPLARLTRRYWKNNETFQAQLEVANFGSEDLQNAVLAWKLLDETGAAAVSGHLAPQSIPLGNDCVLGMVEFPLAGLTPAKKYKFVLGLEGSRFENDWDIWVFADHLPVTPDPQIHVCHTLDQAALQQLEAGGTVLLLAPQQNVKVDSVIGFSSIFWNTAWTRNQEPHTLGIVCNPDHPAFAAFPTESHSNWQWWELIHQSAAMTLNSLPAAMRPLVQPIDTWFENRRLGLLFEAKVAQGKLLVCSMDLETDLEKRVVARQMRYSLMMYMASPAFAPTVSIDPEAVFGLFNS